MPATSKSFNAAAKRRARTLHAEGHGCNAIAKQLGVAPSTISKWAKDERLPFDRRQTAMAVRAHTIDLREASLLLAQKAVVAAHDMLDRLDGGYLVFSFGGQDNEYAEHELDEPPVEVVRNAVVTAGIAIDKALKVSSALDEGEDLPAVDAWLAHMIGDDDEGDE